MEKRITTGVAGLFLMICLHNAATAQTTAMLSPKKQDVKDIVALQSYKPGLFTETGSLPLNGVNAKTIRSFKSFFHTVTDQQWFLTEKFKYQTTFIDKEGRKGRALLHQNGYLYYAIICDNENNLSNEQRSAVKSKYDRYKICSVNEVITEEKRMWIFTLEDHSSVIKIRLNEDNSIDELEYYHKNFPSSKQKDTPVQASQE